MFGQKKILEDKKDGKNNLKTFPIVKKDEISNDFWGTFLPKCPWQGFESTECTKNHVPNYIFFFKNVFVNILKISFGPEISYVNRIGTDYYFSNGKFYSSFHTFYLS